MRISLAALALTAVTCMASAVHTGAMEVSGSASVPPAGGLSTRYAAVAFDYFVLFNPDSVVSVAERVVPGKGRNSSTSGAIDSSKYSWLRSITQRYVDFFAITEDALVYAAAATHLELTSAQRRQLLDAYLHLAPWPDTAGALRRLTASGVRVVTIANFSFCW